MTSIDNMTRVLLIDDHVLVRDSLACRLEDEPDLTVPETAGDALAGLALAAGGRFDLVIFDINMPGMNCFEAARKLNASNDGPQVVFLSAYWNDSFIEQATNVGANGMLSKSDTPEVLVDAIRTISDGGVFFSNEVRARLRINLDPDDSRIILETKMSGLTPRELDVLREVGMGKSRKQIAAAMGIASNTVAVHTNRIMQKLAIHDRVGLARFAIKVGLSPL